MPALVYPVPLYAGRSPVITSPFRDPARPTHQGVDILFKRIPADGGTMGVPNLPEFSARYYMPNDRLPALAIADGVVKVAKRIGTGGYVQIDHPKLGITSQYMHLARITVKPGQSVLAGTPVGSISYNPSGYKLAHLHFQLRQNGVLVDPAPFLAKLPKIRSPWGWQVYLNMAALGVLGYLGYRYIRGRI